MPSQTRLAPIIGKTGTSTTAAGGRREHEVAVVDVDSTLAHLLGIADGMKVVKPSSEDLAKAHELL